LVFEKAPFFFPFFEKHHGTEAKFSRKKQGCWGFHVKLLKMAIEIVDFTHETWWIFP